MRRRRVLAALPSVLGGFAGCARVAPPDGGPGGADRSTGTPDGNGSDAPDETGSDVPGAPGCTYGNPVYEERVFPDPSVVRALDGPWYAYATYHVWGDDDRPLVPVLRSTDLVDWTYVGEAFRERPDWKPGGVWAPAVARVDGRYLCYYSLAEWGDPNPGIGVAVAETPAGPFDDRGELLRSEAVGVPNSIDPYLAAGEDGPHLLWGSHRGVYVAPLAPDGLSLSGSPERVAGEGVEAASVLQREGWYYLLVSAGTCCAGADSTYHVLAGRARELTGTYEAPSGRVLSEGQGHLVVRGGDHFAGPGHTDVVTDAVDSRWLVHHGYERSDPWTGETPRRVLFLSPLEWRDGWPVVPGLTPPVEAACPRVEDR